MAEGACVSFTDQEQRTRRLQLHNVDGVLRVNLNSALLNFEASSFSRTEDGLVLEAFNDSQYSALSFQPNDHLIVTAVRREAGDPMHIVPMVVDELNKRGLDADQIAKRLLAELEERYKPEDRLSVLMRSGYPDPSGVQPMQHELPAATGNVDINHPQPDTLSEQVQHTPGQLGIMQLAPGMAGAQSGQSPESDLNQHGKKRRYCGACQNHNVRTPVTFQHQQVCEFKNCPCNLCAKKRKISQAQQAKRHAQKSQQSGDEGGGHTGHNGLTLEQQQQEQQHLQVLQQQQQPQQHVLQQPPQMQQQQVAPPSPADLAVPIQPEAA